MFREKDLAIILSLGLRRGPRPQVRESATVTGPSSLTCLGLSFLLYKVKRTLDYILRFQIVVVSQ